MRAVIGGCGRVGAALATSLSTGGHEVAVIDRDPDAFRRLGTDFSGGTIAGVMFDRQVLERAGIERADVYIAVGSGDNSNVVSARVAREHYRVPRVVTRIADPVRAEIFERMGVVVVAAAQWTADTLLSLVGEDTDRVEGTVGTVAGEIVLITLTLPPDVHQVPVEKLFRHGQSVVAGITRGGASSLPHPGGVLEGGDVVHLAVHRPALQEVRLAVADLGLEST